jgi:hypothetical protein
MDGSGLILISKSAIRNPTSYPLPHAFPNPKSDIRYPTSMMYIFVCSPLSVSPWIFSNTLDQSPI